MLGLLENATSVTFGANGRSEQKQDWDSIVEGSFYLGDSEVLWTKRDKKSWNSKNTNIR